MQSDILVLQVSDPLEITYARHDLVLNARLDVIVCQITQVLQVPLPLFDLLHDLFEQVLQLLIEAAGVVVRRPVKEAVAVGRPEVTGELSALPVPSLVPPLLVEEILVVHPAPVLQ